ncbi:GAF domain-containing sensor histidine kinase [Actinoallomurus iriomotensis]|uniref:GAF domain-containing sensor histidine kinase n=1 Tax=Actinoallomurus iriomotensis TaxID=478107 RepID=UPI0025524A2B|nr:GAF domain-containing sensor histidine kinase [Actinoallomurus iriomotensis]
MIFDAAAKALGCLIKADYTTINRREADQTMSIVTLYRAPGVPEIDLPFGGRWPLKEDTASAAALRTHRPARRAAEAIRSEVGDWHRATHVGHVVACPVIVEDRLWGTMACLYIGSEPPPDDTEERMAKFVELLNSTIAQAETRAELIASRARLVANADATRRRIERDLHDGVQQHLISLALQLRAAEANVPPEHGELRRQLSDTAQGLSDVLTELQEISRGLQPPMLARRGLPAALKALVSRSPVPVELRIGAYRRLPEKLEVTIYYLVSEALTNVLKYAHASVVRIELGGEESEIHLTVRDDGIGGADPARGSGLTGLGDRVRALGGTIQVTSPAGCGTSLAVTIPFRS